VAKIDELTFGSTVVEGKKYRHDVLIFADGTVKKRRAGLRQRIQVYWFSHPPTP
jgi:hypothetical protein